MKRSVLVALLFFVLNSLVGQNQQFFQRYNKISFELYKTFVHGNRNEVFSPYFVIQNFAPIYMGSAGRTHAELAFFFGFDKDIEQFKSDFEQIKLIVQRDNTPGTRIESFTGLIIEDSLRRKINPQFIQQISKFLVDSIVFTDFTRGAFEVKTTLNRLIKYSAINILPEPIYDMPAEFPGGIMLLSSAYFTGNWEKNFTSTYLAPFYIDKYGRHTKSLLYMTTVGYFKYVQGPDYQVVELPYEGNKLSLMIILPNENVDLQQLQQNITYDDYSLLAKGLVLQRIRIFLPILEINSFFSLKDSLQSRIPSLFKRGANLTRMIKKIVWIDQVYHAVKFKIEAEAELKFQRFIDFQKEKDLNKILFINRPFIFFVKDNSTNAILFIGHVFKPI